MESTGDTISIKKEKEKSCQLIIQWGYCEINPITQVIEHFYKQRKKN